MSRLRITDVKVYPFDTSGTGGQGVAMGEITLDDAVTLRGFRIIAAKGGGMFVGFPSKKGGDGQWRELVIPVTKEARDQIRTALLDAWGEG